MRPVAGFVGALLLLGVPFQSALHAQATVTVAPPLPSVTVRFGPPNPPVPKLHSVETIRAGKGEPGKPQVTFTPADPDSSQPPVMRQEKEFVVQSGPPVIVQQTEPVVERTFALKLWRVDPNIDPKIHRQVPLGDFKILFLPAPSSQTSK